MIHGQHVALHVRLNILGTIRIFRVLSVCGSRRPRRLSGERELRGETHGLVTSSKAWTAIETLAIITVRQLPPSESFSSRVSLESRYGTN